MAGSFLTRSLPRSLQRPPDEEVRCLEADLDGLRTSIMELSEDDHPTSTHRCLMNRLRELSYDAEDYLEMLRHSGLSAGCSWHIHWVLSKVRGGRRRPPLLSAKDISELRSRVKDAIETRQAYLQSGSSETTTKICRPQAEPDNSRRITSASLEPRCLDEPMNELDKVLALDSDLQLKVVAIFGLAGVGKTTLATRLYHCYRGRFQCGAFLRVSRKPERRRLLASVLSQIKGRSYHGSWDEQDLIHNIKQYLHGKSYFIIVDDIWATSVWDLLSRAFPVGNCCSRIVTTTQIEDVAFACGNNINVLNMRSLSIAQSLQLFRSRINHIEGYDYDNEECKEVSYRIAKACGDGLPLAVINIAGMLSAWPDFLMKEWVYVQNSLSRTSQGIEGVLNLIYNNIPPRLKTCLLYLSIYPEDCVTRKDDLVKQWVAEGIFGQATEDDELNNQGGYYFDELLQRGLIQPAHTGYNNQVLSCTVHNMVLDFIAHKAMQENFITVINYPETVSGPSEKVHRLSIRFGGAKSARIPERLSISQVRSLRFSGFFKCVPSLVECWLLRVLILDIWSDQDEEILDLTLIGELLQLRYLKIESNMVIKLPTVIGRLMYLQTLDVAAKVATFPLDIYCLKTLWHLRLPREPWPFSRMSVLLLHSIGLVRRIGDLTSLRSLSNLNLSACPGDDVRDLGNLTNMQDLHLTCSAAPSSRQQVSNIEWLVSSLWKSSQLKTLILDSEVSSNTIISCDGLSSTVSCSDPSLESFQLSPRAYILSNLPKWVRCLSNLRILKIAVRDFIASVDVGVLEELPVLAVLSLHVRTTPAEKIIFSKGFQALKYFKFTCNALCVEFTGVAMHQVQTLKLSFNVDTMNQYKPEDAGIRGLPGLEVISVKIGGASTDQSSREAAKRRLVNAFIGDQQPRHLRFLEENHQQSPIINVKTVDVIIHGDTELSSSVDVITRGGPDEQHIVEETDINGVADSRIISWEPSSFTQKPGWVNWRPRNGVRLFKTVQGIAYVMRQHMKHAGFRVLNEVASVNQDMERLTMIIDSSPDSQPQEWVLQVQDLAYDIQDFVDIYNWLRIRSQSHALAHVSNIVQLKESIRTLREWQHSGISSHHGVSGSSAVSSGLPSSSCPCVPEDRLVGIEEPMSELLELVLLPGEFEKATKQLRMSSIMGITMEQLASWHARQEKGNVRSLERPTEVQKPRRQLRFVEGDVVDQVVYLPSPTPAEEYRLRVISIVGYRGIGKTALARAVYDVANTVHSTSDLRCGAFDRLAWVVASQCSRAGDILNSIYQQVREQGNDPVTDTYMFKESLRNKRFLVVIDDLQAAGLWYDVQSAFPEAHTGSRVIVTTSIGSVASACSSDRYIYRMRGLGYSNAEKLFWARVDCRTNRTPFLEYALQDTLRKSGGLPLALISVANYLCRKRQDLLPGAPGAFEEMNRVLSHCYNSLPDNGHRTCFLSLSAFPQGQLIKRKKLIRRWIAEGLAVGDSVLSAEQVASNRFDELIDRSLIEPVLTGNNSKVKGFLVLGVIKDFIVNKSVSKEFVTLIQNDELLFPNKKVAHPVRRLSVQGGTHSERVAKGIELDRVRSLTICNTVPFDFKDCWLLRLLDLDACQGIDKIVFHNICKLVFLKYLNLRGSDVYKISKKIKKLECLETLDIRDTRVETLPIEVLMLPCLAHLFGQFELPQKLKDPAIRSKLQAFFSHKSRLQTLSGFVMVENNGFEHIVLHMRLLRKVTIWCRHSITSSYQRHLLTSSLQKRLAGRNALDSVSINFGNESINFLNNIEAPCALIGSMKLWGRLKSLPSFITSHDTTLSELQLSSTGLTIEALSLLQNLRRLLYLKIVEDGDGFFGDCFIVQSGGFPSLLRLCFEALKLPKVHIHEGGMSSLTSLHLLCPELATFNSTVLEESYTDTYPEKSFRGVHSGRDLKEVYPKIRFKETDSVIIRSDEIVEENDEINTKGKSKEIKRTDSETSFNEIDLGTTDSKKIKNKIDLKELVKGIEHLQHLNELVLHPSVSREILDAWKEEARGYINIPKVTRGCTSMLSLNRGSSGTTKKKVGYKVQTSDRHVLVEVPAEQSEISGMQSEGIKGGNLSTPTSSVRLLLELRKYILLLASVVAMVTYAAGGFSPPGGVLKDTAAGHVADVSILRDTQFHRYLVFYFNATAFAASLLVIILVFIVAFLDDKEAEDSNSSRIICHYRKNRRIVVRSLRVIMLSDLLALMGAYAAATYQRDTFVNVYSWLPLFFVSVYLATKMALALFFTESSGVLEAHEAELLKAEERYRKVLLVLATFAVSITYTAGLSTPWGIWDTTTEAGHRPGDGFLKDLDKTRLKVFFGFNTAAFAASLLIVMMLLDSKLRKNLDYRRLNVFFSFGIAVFVASLLIIAELLDSKLRSKNNAAFGLIVLMLGSLVGAYIAGCCRQANTTIYMVSLVAAVVVYILFLSIRRAITNQRAESNNGRNEQGNQEASEYGPTEEEDSGAYDKVRSLVMLLATLAATITYQAGLDPPGGIWQDNKDGHMAGDPILLTVNARRYNAFFYCNSFAFAASLVAITILLVQKMSVLRHRLLNVLMTLNLLGLVGAYVAGASRDSRSSIYALGLAPVVFLYVGVHVALMRVQGLLRPHNIRDVVQLVDNMRKRLLLFAIFLTTMTYKAGLTPPGGFLLQDNHPAGHHAGDPVLSYIAPHRYKAFFYCNTVSFMLSIVLIIFLGIPPLYRQAIVRSHALSVCTAAGFHGLMGAYAAGSTQHLKTYIYIFVLSAVVVCFLFIQLMVYWFTRGGPPDVMVMTIGDSTTTQGAAVETNSQGNKATKKKRMHAKRQYLMLLGILGATVTYQAALKPPGGAWQSSSGDYKAGNPIMYDNRRTRYLVFFYSNSTSFMASIVVILLQLEPKRLFGHHQKAWLRRWLIQTIILDLLGFLGAYAAGSTRAIKTSLYVILLFIAVLLAYSGMPFLLLRIMKKKPEITE